MLKFTIRKSEPFGEFLHKVTKNVVALSKHDIYMNGDADKLSHRCLHIAAFVGRGKVNSLYAAFNMNARYRMPISSRKMRIYRYNI